jgi:hypothetical protein
MLAACEYQEEPHTRLEQVHALLSARPDSVNHASLSTTPPSDTSAKDIFTALLELEKEFYNIAMIEHKYFIAGSLITSILLVGVIISSARYHKRHQTEHAQFDKRLADMNNLKMQKQFREADELESSAVYHKAKDIAHTLKVAYTKDTFNEAEWQELIRLVNVRWNGIIVDLQQQHADLSSEEIQICCLYLIDIPIVYIGHFHGYGRSTIYRKNKEILSKLKAPSGAKLKDILQEKAEKSANNTQ